MWVKNMHLGWAFRVGIIFFPPKGGKEKKEKEKDNIPIIHTGVNISPLALC